MKSAKKNHKKSKSRLPQFESYSPGDGQQSKFYDEMVALNNTSNGKFNMHLFMEIMTGYGHREMREDSGWMWDCFRDWYDESAEDLEGVDELFDLISNKDVDGAIKWIEVYQPDDYKYYLEVSRLYQTGKID